MRGVSSKGHSSSSIIHVAFALLTPSHAHARYGVVEVQTCIVHRASCTGTTFRQADAGLAAEKFPRIGVDYLCSSLQATVRNIFRKAMSECLAASRIFGL